jgi:hypothetical protein
VSGHVDVEVVPFVVNCDIDCPDCRSRHVGPVEPVSRARGAIAFGGRAARRVRSILRCESATNSSGIRTCSRGMYTCALRSRKTRRHNGTHGGIHEVKHSDFFSRRTVHPRGRRKGTRQSECTERRCGGQGPVHRRRSRRLLDVPHTTGCADRRARSKSVAIGRTDSVRTSGACRELGPNRAPTCRVTAWHRRTIHPVDDDWDIPDRESATTSDAPVPHVTIGCRISSRIPEIGAIVHGP